MKIGLFNDSFPPSIDGVAQAVVNYASIINEKFGSACVVTPKYPNVTDDYPFEVYRYHSIKFAGEFPYRVGNPFSPFAIRDVNKMKLDLMHVHSPFASSLFAHEISLMNRKRIPTVFTYHTKFDVDISRYVDNKKVKAGITRFMLSNIKRADEVWTVSEGTIESLRRIGYHGEVRVMPNGTDFKRGRASDEALAEIDRVYGLAAEPLVFMYCGRVMWYKNLKLILDSLKILAGNGVRFKMIMLGDGPDRPYVEQYTHTIGIDDRVIFTGAIYDREKVRAYFSRADLLLFPSTYDTSGLVVKEAAACGCASALIAGSCAAEGVEDGVSGLLAEQETAECFAEKVGSAVSAPGLLKRLGKEAEEKVYYSWEDAVSDAYKRYEEIIEEHNRKRN